MNAKEFLKRVRKIDRLIENKLIEIRQWKELAENTTTDMSGERVQSTHNPHKIADAIGKYIDIEAELAADIESLKAAKKDVLEVIEQLDALEYDVLHKIYVQYLDFTDVADRHKMSYSWATTIHGQAVKHVQDILNRREHESVN
jgi:DNA-directed RNA polymerase specialized sigma subunit